MKPIAIAAIVPTTPTEGNPPDSESELSLLPLLAEPLLFPEPLSAAGYAHPVWSTTVHAAG